MGLEYTNRRGVTYRLFKGRTPKGNDKFYMVKGARARSGRAKGEPADEIPAGFELREDPATGVVSVRRIRDVATTEEEAAIVEAALRDRGDLHHFVVDAEDDRLSVFVTQYDLFPGHLERMDALFGEGVFARRWDHSRDQLSEALRFVLVNAETRRFDVRWPRIGGGRIETFWLPLGDGPLPSLVADWIPRIGDDSALCW